MKKCVFDAEGFPVAHYDTTVHGDAIPAEAVEITTEQWLEFVNNPGERRWVDNQVAVYEPPLVESVPTILHRQLFQGLAEEGIISWDKAEDACGARIIPPDFDPYFAAISDPADRSREIIRVRSAASFTKEDPFVEHVVSAQTWQPDDLDAFWTLCLGL